MHRTIERIHVKDKYGDIDIGLILIRGENVVLCGEIVRELARLIIYSQSINLSNSSLAGS